MKITRYFNIELDISLKCQICGEILIKKIIVPIMTLNFAIFVQELVMNLKIVTNINVSNVIKLGIKQLYVQ